LPAAYREPFVLRHLEQWPYATIAEVLGITPMAVETRVARARRMLLDEMTKRGWP
jgi:RNA polymerase sigma-70 factor (ECF subfamily)